MTNFKDRQTGRTTRLLGLLDKYPNSVFLVPIHRMLNYTKQIRPDLANRMFALPDYLKGQYFRGSRDLKVVLDHTFFDTPHGQDSLLTELERELSFMGGEILQQTTN